MSEKPILFNSDMVRALLAGEKTQTRRVVKPLPDHSIVAAVAHVATETATGEMIWSPRDRADQTIFVPDGKHAITAELRCPYGGPGDRLWVRETYWHLNGRFHMCGPSDVMYADQVERIPTGTLVGGDWVKRPSIHMPRWASRLTLEVTSVRVERLQAISEDDARAEGVTLPTCVYLGDRCNSARCPMHSEEPHRLAFRSLWHTLHAEDGPHGWEASPWCWCVSFRRLP